MRSIRAFMKQPRLGMCLLFILYACSDDTVTRDLGVDRSVVRDRSHADQVADAAKDVTLGGDRVIDRAKEGGGDLIQDARPLDLLGDTRVGDASPTPLWGTIRRGVAPFLDGKGDLYVGIVHPFFGPPVIIQAADLSQSGNKVRYGIDGPPGDYELWAFLDDNGSASSFLPLADAGDLVMSHLIPVHLTSTPQQVDIVLDKIEGAPVDGGARDGVVLLGGLKGKITRNVSPSLDAKGVLYVSLHTEVPPAGPIASTTVNNADLSSSYAAEASFLADLPEGGYYLWVFLDDNLDVNPFAPAPDKDDLGHAKPIQVHVVAGAITTQDVVLDKVTP
jgi:hypothetical protein